MSKVYTLGIVSPKGFDMTAAEPVDQREIIEFYTDLISLPKCYLGIEVKIQELAYAKYKLKGLPSSDLNNWELVDSSPGTVGPIGPEGAKGDDGDSAYQVYLNNGGILTELDWLASLHGTDGIQGGAGPIGPEGPEGPVGGSATTLEAGTITGTTYGITSDGSIDDIILPEANTTQAGLLGAGKWNEIVANTLKVSDINHNVSTNLTEGTSTTTTVDVNSSDGTNATILAASTIRAGIMTKAKFDEVVVNNAKISYPGDQDISLQNVTDTGNTTTNNINVASVNGVEITSVDFNTIFAGKDAGLNSSGVNSIGIGLEALKDNTGIASVGVGAYSLHKNTGNNVSGFGSNCLSNNTGAYNTALGVRASDTADVALNALTNCTVLGANAIQSKSNQVTLGDTTVTEVLSSGVFKSTALLAAITDNEHLITKEYLESIVTPFILGNSDSNIAANGTSAINGDAHQISAFEDELEFFDVPGQSTTVLRLSQTFKDTLDSSPLTTKGDLYTYSTANARLGIGTDGQVLTADPLEVTGMKWATPASGVTDHTLLSNIGTNTHAQIDTHIANNTGVNTGDQDLSGYLLSLVQGSNVTINNSDPQNPIISAAATTSAGILDRVYFTGDEITPIATSYYITAREDKGTIASVVQTVTVGDNQKAYFPQDFLSIILPPNTVVNKGAYSAFLTAEVDSDAADQRLTVEVYLANADGTVIDSGVLSQPIGDLGVRVISILDSGIIDMKKDNPTQINLSVTFDDDLSIPPGERIRYHVSAEKSGSNSGDVEISMMFGTDFNSYVETPSIATSDDIVNNSTVVGFTVTDAINNMVTKDTDQLTGLTGDKAILGDWVWDADLSINAGFRLWLSNNVDGFNSIHSDEANTFGHGVASLIYRAGGAGHYFYNGDGDTLGDIHASNLSGVNTGDQTKVEIDALGINASTVTNGVYTTGTQTIGGSKTFDNGTNTTVTIKADDSGVALLRLHGDSQGTGAVEVGQSASYGGGMSYNGDGTSEFVSGEGSDRITFYAKNAGARTEVFSYAMTSTGAVEFNGTITAPSFVGALNGNATTATTATTASNVAANSINSDAYVDGSIDRVHLAADIIDSTKVANNAIGNEHIKDNAINSEHYVDGSIDRVHLAADIIDGTKIANDSINSEHYVAGSIDNEHIADNAINSEHYADNSIDALHLNVSGNGNTSQYLRSDADGSFTWATPPDNNTVYTHPSYNGDDFSLDTGALTGATVISDIDINVTTDTSGHVTDANGTVSTRTLTLGNLGYTGATNANYITNNTQLTNGAGYTTNTGTTTASNSQTFTNKGGNISQWTNDSGYTTASGTMSSWTIKEGNGTESTSVTNGETLTIAQGSGITSEMTSTSSGGTITITNTAPNIVQTTVSGNAGSATVLQNARTIAGVSFNGSANITLNNSNITNGAGYTTNTGDITGVTAGTGMSGGGTSGTVTLNCTINTPAEVGLGNLSSSGNALSGNFVATGNVTAYSDERLKTDIETIDSALDKVNALRGVTYVKDGEKGIGVIAQEVEKVLPEVVLDGEEYKSVAYGNIVGVLIEAIKEQDLKIERLEGLVELMLKNK